MEQPLLFLSPWAETSVLWGRGDRGIQQQLPGKQKPCLHQADLACWRERPRAAVWPRSDQPAPLRLPGGGSQRAPKDPASFSTSGPKKRFFFLLVRF